MISERKQAQRDKRRREFLAQQGPYAVHHDPRTWADNNGGVFLGRGMACLLKQWPEAKDAKEANLLSVKAALARKAEEE